MKTAALKNPAGPQPVQLHANSAVEIRIDELVLHGFDPQSRHQIAEAIERELKQILTDRPEAANPLQIAGAAHLDGGAFQVHPGAPAETTGAQVAKALFGQLNVATRKSAKAHRTAPAVPRNLDGRRSGSA